MRTTPRPRHRSLYSSSTDRLRAATSATSAHPNQRPAPYIGSRYPSVLRTIRTPARANHRATNAASSGDAPRNGGTLIDTHSPASSEPGTSAVASTWDVEPGAADAPSEEEVRTGVGGTMAVVRPPAETARSAGD